MIIFIHKISCMNNVDHEAMNTWLGLWSPSTEAMITPLKKQKSFQNQLVPVHIFPFLYKISRFGMSWPRSGSRTINCVRSMYVCSACLGFIQANDGFPPRWRQAAGEDYFADLECDTLSSLITWLIIEQLNQISIASQTYDICRGPIITPPSYKLNSKNYCLSTSLLERNSTLQIRTAGPHN